MSEKIEYEIRRPRPEERRACRMLLPHATAGEFFIAAAGQPRVVVGAVALAGDLVDLHVIPPLRRRGIGRALLSRAIEEAKTRGLTSVRAWNWCPADGEAQRAWQALGFTVRQRRFDHEVKIDEALAVLAPLLERVRDRIPLGAKVVTLAEADIDAVTRLHQQYLGGSAQLLRPLLDGSAANAYDRHMSSVLLLDGEVVGAVMGRTFPDGSCEVDSRLLHPSVRRRWANVWLMHEGFRRIYANGIRIMRYFTLDQHEDTRQLGERFGGAITGESIRMVLEL